jgi:hypothetical protein
MTGIKVNKTEGNNASFCRIWISFNSWFQGSAAMLRSALFWDITRRCVVIVYRRFGTTYRSHLHGSRVPWPVKMGPIRRPETSVNTYHTTPRNIPEECSSLSSFRNVWSYADEVTWPGITRHCYLHWFHDLFALRVSNGGDVTWWLQQIRRTVA